VSESVGGGVNANDQMWQFFRDFSLPSDKRP